VGSLRSCDVIADKAERNLDRAIEEKQGQRLKSMGYELLRITSNSRTMGLQSGDGLGEGCASTSAARSGLCCPARGTLLAATLKDAYVFYEALDLPLRQPNVQECVRILLVLRAVSDGIVDVRVTHFHDAFRSKIRHIEFRYHARVPASVLGMTVRALLCIQRHRILAKGAASAQH